MVHMRKLNKVCITILSSSGDIEMCPPKSCEEALIFTN